MDSPHPRKYEQHIWPWPCVGNNVDYIDSRFVYGYVTPQVTTLLRRGALVAPSAWPNQSPVLIMPLQRRVSSYAYLIELNCCCCYRKELIWGMYLEFDSYSESKQYRSNRFTETFLSSSFSKSS